MAKVIKIADLFCGAGGSSKGAADAGRYLGYQVKLTAINHWDIAIATHQANMSRARHLCTPLERIRPRDLYEEGELDLLWASPECTHHSVARGGRPINDQSRSTAYRVTEWAEALRPRIILVENVPEFTTWGPLIRKRVKTRKRHKNGKPVYKLAWRPDPKRKGDIFRAWVANLEAIGYKVEHRVLCAADYGDPTTRRRLFVQAVRRPTKIVWPEPTHAPRTDADMLGERKAYIPARAIIDWDIPSQSIFERKRPLCDNTLRRIEIGLWKYGLKAFMVPQQQGWDKKNVQSVEDPVPTVTGTSRGEGLCEPYLVRLQGQSNAENVDRPVSPVCSMNKHGLVQPFLVPNFGERATQTPRTHSIDEPAPTITSHGGGCLVEPFIVRLQNHSSAYDLEDPISTVRAKGLHHALAEPFLLRYNGSHSGRRDGDRRSQDIEDPVGTLDTSNRYAVAEPFLLSIDQTGGNGHYTRPVDKPLATVGTKQSHAIVEPFLVKYYGTARAQSVDDPLDTVTAKDRHALVKPILEINGDHYTLDIRFRMLQPKELAAAQGFPEDYEFTGNKTEVVKQIGNAVPYHTARALVLAALSQQSDIREFIEAAQAA
jgi:DNA (cytosine-5)-methyltransferase 1